MKKIINGKQYDTSTAKKLGMKWRNEGNNLDYVCETLYQKKSGEYFLHGLGGARTCYAKRLWDGYGAGEEIVPLTMEAAKEWARDNLPADAYNAAFGAIVDDGSVTACTMRMPTALLEATRRAAAAQGVTISAFIQSAIEAALKK